MKFGPADDKMGIRGAPSSQIFLSDCVLPEDAMLGAPGDGFKVAMRTLDGGRIGIGAQAVGIARAAFEDATRYALDRKTFGQPIAEHQAIQFKLADMATQVEAARLLTRQAARMKDAGQRSDIEAGMAEGEKAIAEGKNVFDNPLAEPESAPQIAAEAPIDTPAETAAAVPETPPVVTAEAGPVTVPVTVPGPEPAPAEKPAQEKPAKAAAE